MRTFCAQKLRMAGVMSIQAACPVQSRPGGIGGVTDVYIYALSGPDGIPRYVGQSQRIQEVFGVPVELWLAEAA